MENRQFRHIHHAMRGPLKRIDYSAIYIDIMIKPDNYGNMTDLILEDLNILKREAI